MQLAAVTATPDILSSLCSSAAMLPRFTMVTAYCSTASLSASANYMALQIELHQCAKNSLLSHLGPHNVTLSTFSVALSQTLTTPKIQR